MRCFLVRRLRNSQTLKVILPSRILDAVKDPAHVQADGYFGARMEVTDVERCRAGLAQMQTLALLSDERRAILKHAQDILYREWELMTRDFSRVGRHHMRYLQRTKQTTGRRMGARRGRGGGGEGGGEGGDGGDDVDMWDDDDDDDDDDYEA